MGKKRFDATLKQIFEAYLAQWLPYFARLLGVPKVGRARVIDSDVSTVTAAADKVVRVGGRKPWIFHLELVSAHRHRLPEQLLLYNVLIGDRHRLPVRTAVLLLRPEADRASLDGKLNKEGSEGQCYLAFSYTVVRLWEQSVEALLDAGVGLLPLAPLANVATDQLPGVIGRIDQRLRAEVTDAERADLWSASYILLGLRYSAPFAAQLLEGVRGMEESTTFQAIITQGALREARKILFSLGTQRLGKPDSATRAAVEAIAEVSQLERLIGNLSQASSWADLLQKPKPRQSNGRRRKS